MTGPVDAPDLVSQLADLRAEFPDWTIDAVDGDPPWRALRGTGRSGPLELTAGSYGDMREHLDEIDAIDCQHAIDALRDALRTRGLDAEVHGRSVATRTRTGIQRTVHARRGAYTWGSGVELGPIGDADATAEQMLPGLGMRP